MNFKELANTRYSVRKYSDQKVEEGKLETILETARKAPSAVNFQPYRLFVVESKEKLEAVKACYHRDWIKLAPVILVVVGSHDMAWKRNEDGKDHTDIDAAIFIDHIMLQAADLGLGTCWVCNFEVSKLSKLLNLSSTEEPIAMIPLGYPQKKDIPVKKRKGVDEIVVRL